MQTESRSVSSFGGVDIYYDFYPGRSGRVVLVVPGFWRHRRYPSMMDLAARIVARGHATAVMDLRGHGESSGRFGFNRHEWQDVAAVARDVRAVSGASRIDVIAFSIGGAIAITAMNRVRDLPWGELLLISAVAAFGTLRPWINPWVAHRHLAASQVLRTPRFDWMFALSPKIRAADEIGTIGCPVTIVHVHRDWLVHHSHAAELFGRAREPKRLHLLEIGGQWHADRIFAQAPEAIDPILDQFLS